MRGVIAETRDCFASADIGGVSEAHADGSRIMRYSQQRLLEAYTPIFW
jgi:hypothetical protein